MQPKVIAIDGPALAGKSTIARHLAATLGFDHLVTGKLYRAVAWQLNQMGLDASHTVEAAQIAENLQPDDLQNPALFSSEMDRLTPLAAGIPSVRAALLEPQRAFCRRPPHGRGAILDGRDIGSFVWPQADAKLFVTASLPARAERKWKELENGGKHLHSGQLSPTSDSILADIAARDQRDAANMPSNSTIAPDVMHMDTTDMDVPRMLATALQLVTPRL